MQMIMRHLPSVGSGSVVTEAGYPDPSVRGPSVRALPAGPAVARSLQCIPGKAQRIQNVVLSMATALTRRLILRAHGALAVRVRSRAVSGSG